MPPAVTKELRVVYGAQTIGGVSDWELDRGLVIDTGYEKTRVEFDAVYSGAATQTVFAAAAVAFEAAMRTPRARLQVLATDGVGTDTLLDLNPTVAAGGNTGFNADAKAVKPGSPHDSLRSRRYHCTVEVEMPADLAGQAGRRSSRVEVFFSRGRVRTITISGVYTALAGNGARAQYNASIGAYATTIQTAIGGTYSAIPDSERATTDDADKLCEFSRSYRAIIQPESTAGTNDVEILEPHLRITRAFTAPGDSQIDADRPRRLVDIDISYSAGIDSAADTALVEKWAADIRPQVLIRVAELFGLGEIAVVDERVGPDDEYENVLAASMRIRGAQGNLIELEEIVSATLDEGKRIVKTWGPNLLSGYVFQGPAASRFSVSTTILELETGAKGSDRITKRDSDEIIFLSREESERRFEIGLEGESIKLRHTRVRDNYEFVEQIAERPPTGGDAGGGGGTSVARESGL